MAGVAAMLNEKMAFPQGNINPEIYAIAQNHPSSFHDTTPSSSGVTSCNIHTPSLCNNSTPGPSGLSGGQDGYPLTTGYDMVTGVGSLDIASFVTNFASSLPQPTVTVTPSSQTITPGDILTLTVKVDGGSGQPTPAGSVKLTTLNYVSPDATLVNGTVTFNIPAYTLAWAVAPATFTAQYTPDGASSSLYSAAEGSNTVNITALTTAVTVNLASTTVSTADDVVVNVSVAGPSGAPTPTGTIQIMTVGSGPGYTASATLSGGATTLTIPAGALPPGPNGIDTTYTPDQAGYKLYDVNVQNTNITVTQAPKTTPTVSPTLLSSVTLADLLTVDVKVTPAAGAPTPTGSVAVASPRYTNSANLSGGSAQVLIGPGWLQVGTDSLTISYYGDNNTNPASATATVVVTKAVSTVTIDPMPSTVTADQDVYVQMAVNWPMNLPRPTGSVTVTSGSYTSPALSPVSGPLSLNIPAGSLPTGTDTLTVSYSGDDNYTAGTGTALVTIKPATPTLTLAGNNVTIGTPGATVGNISTVTVTPGGLFTGSVDLTAAVTTSPAGAQNLPTLSFGSTTPVVITSTAAGHATLTVTTTPATTSAVVPPPMHRVWFPAGGTALGLLVLFGIPARRRKLRAWLGMVLLFAGVSVGMTACSGGGTSTPPPVTHPGTTAGTYVVTVTATSGAVTAKTTLQVKVD